MKSILRLLLLLLPALSLMGQQREYPLPERPAKNVILLISDGTSLPTVSLARWYQRALDPQAQHLALDPYLSGSVITYCSNAPIGDSAPTTSCYMTGVPSIDGFIATYPYSEPHNDLVPLDSSWAYRPVVTLLEAAKQTQGKRIGVVCTCEFPHATPADCTAHTPSRRLYKSIVPQMVDNGVDLLLGGGTSLMTSELKERLSRQGIALYLDDLAAMRAHRGGGMWALFGEMDMPYDMDRRSLGDTLRYPSLAEMTETAIRNLENPNGFVLMVEGSKVDWAAHANDPVAMATEFLAFDKAVAVALDYAQRDGNTIVLVTADHGNSGMSIGRPADKGYARLTLDELIMPLTRFRYSSVELGRKTSQTALSLLADSLYLWSGIRPSEEELAEINAVEDYACSTLSTEQRKAKYEELSWSQKYRLQDYFVDWMKRHLIIGFTTHGHTGEEVFLASYTPQQLTPIRGCVTNMDLHNYMRTQLGLEQTMLELSEEYYAPHDALFPQAQCEITGDQPEEKRITIHYKGHEIELRAYQRRAWIDGVEQELPTPVVYVSETNKFYLSRTLSRQL